MIIERFKCILMRIYDGIEYQMAGPLCRRLLDAMAVRLCVICGLCHGCVSMGPNTRVSTARAYTCVQPYLSDTVGWVN